MELYPHSAFSLQIDLPCKAIVVQYPLIWGFNLSDSYNNYDTSFLKTVVKIGYFAERKEGWDRTEITVTFPLLLSHPIQEIPCISL